MAQVAEDWGRPVKSILAVLAVAVWISAVPAQAQQIYTGTANVAVIMVEFPTYDNPQISPWSEDQRLAWAHDAMADADAYYNEVSYGALRIASSVYGIYQVALDRTASRYAIAQAAQAAAAAHGVDLSGFSRLLYVAPATDNAAGGYGDGSGVWINVQDYALLSNWAMVAHELGHSLLFVNHSDGYSVMGGATEGHFSAFNKEKFHWLGVWPQTRIQTITASGDYLVKPLELASFDGPLALKVQGSHLYYLEFRQPIGFDALNESFPLENADLRGVMSHYPQFGDPFFFLNGLPGPAWTVGKPFCDKSAKLELTVLSESPDGAVVRVKFRSNCNGR